MWDEVTLRDPFYFESVIILSVSPLKLHFLALIQTSLNLQTSLAEVSSFYARFIPKVVERLLEYPNDLVNGTDPDNPPLESPCRLLVDSPRGSLYFIKYIRSKAPIAEPGKRLASYIAENILFIARESDDALADGVTGILGMLDMLLLLTRDDSRRKAVEDIPKETRQALQPWLIRWSRANAEPTLTKLYCDNILNAFDHLDGDPVAYHDFARKRFNSNRLCSLPGCNVADNLRVCMRYVRPHMLKYMAEYISDVKLFNMFATSNYDSLTVLISLTVLS